jgi:hypothetical protein
VTLSEIGSVVGARWFAIAENRLTRVAREELQIFAFNRILGYLTLWSIRIRCFTFPDAFGAIAGRKVEDRFVERRA